MATNNNMATSKRISKDSMAGLSMAESNYGGTIIYRHRGKLKSTIIYIGNDRDQVAWLYI